MDLVGVNVIETAALGRPFQLGMLYDCRKDALVPGITLWDKEQLQQSIRHHPQINTDFSVTASDSIEEKSHLLNIDGYLKLSLLSGLINVRGAAKYLSDTKKSFRQQRLTLHYHSTTKFEELTMNHLASGNIAHYEAFDNDTATHVVTAVLYGANACFVFDREVASDEDKSTVEGEVKAAFDKLKGISVGAQIDLSLNDKQKTAVQKFSCTFYGDFQLQSNPASFEDALNVFADLPKLMGENKELAVPLRVWLYPLDKLHSHAAKLQKEISIGLIKNLESVFETLSTTEMKCSDLLKDTPSLAFAGFCDKIIHMKQNCFIYKLSFMKKLGSLLPKIRGDIEKETALNELLHDHEECPFRGSDLQQWIKEKEQESVIIKTLLRQLTDSGATVEENLDKILMDLEVENVVSYTFTSFEWPDVLLSKQKAFLNPSTMDNNGEDSPDSKQKTGFTSEIKATMKSNLKIYKNLIKSKTCKPAKFIVASKEIKNNPGSCILLYENESDEATCFTPPSKPACPVIEQISGHSVVVKVSPACPATEELRLLYKMKEEKDWKSQSVQSQDTVTLTDLSPDTEYEMKYAAVGKLNYNVDSDVIHLRVIDKKLIDATESVLEILNLIENKCSELMQDNSAVTFSAIHRKIQDMMRYCQTYKQDLSNRIKSVIQSIQTCEEDISALTDLLQAHKESPFNKSYLMEWITVKENESNAVNKFLQQLCDSRAEVNNTFDTFLLDISIKNLVCYTFSSLDLPDDLLSDQEKFLKLQMMKRNSEKKHNAMPHTWLTGSIRETMKKHLKVFKELMLLHGDQSTTFLVTSKEHTIHPGSCILLYENESDKPICFTPPSKPACPVIEQISGHSVVVKVSPACPATEELRLLYKMKEEKDWKSQSVQSQDTVTLTDLSPDTEYEMKYAAVGKLNYNVDSDVIHLRVIDKKLIDATESVLEILNLIENKCSELMQDNSAVTFSAIHRKIRDMMRYCQTYKQDLSNRIKSVIQSIQTCEKDISALIDLLQAHNESPFNKSYLTDWITVKEKESNSVNKFLQQLCDSGAEVNNNLDTFLSDIEVKNLVCYTFSSLDLPDDLLSNQENFLKPSVMMRNSEKKPKAVPQTWLTGSVREKMRELLEIFKELMLLHGDQSTTFLVTSKEHTIHPGSCIILYKYGSDEAICFTPPLKPACPVIEKISGHSVVVKVSPACPATEELRLLYKMKEEKDWKSQSVQNHDTVTLTDLSPDTEYEMKYAAVGKLNYTVDSDVTRATTRSTNIRAV
ncbi:stonustoxin subunit beta-like protein [Labeo rohita]|uniref:Stonustoxin subunit beta-like protein n=1 Tax=Labeo rohita TaxID=84645 RepID=A0A498N9H4_LABRO|nr:stonustoxin subunit beta-like protein [Labeo rohita]